MVSQGNVSFSGFEFVRIIKSFRSKRVLKAVALATVVTMGSTSLLQDAVANGDTRTITLHHVHSGASATVTFKRNGRYDQAALKQLNVLLQDWRRKESTNMDPQLFDIVWEVYRETDASGPIEVIGGYRSPATNAMLRSRSRGVAQTSLHMQGKAMDFYIPGVPLAKIREAGLRLQRGGVGFYPTSGSPFVHLDTGGVRHWPRMSHDQLVRVFPDGKTVHVPSDGRPLAKYDVALAEIERGGSRPGGAGAAFASRSTSDSAGAKASGKNIFASLFGGKDDDDEESAAPAVAAKNTPAKNAPAAADDEEMAAPAQVAAAPAPKPAMVASASDVIPLPTPSPLPRNATSVALAAAPAPAAPTANASLAALAAAVPRPLARPSAAPTASDAVPAEPIVVASADGLVNIPKPQARPALPELIVRGTGADGTGASALSYASATSDIFPTTERLQPGRAPQPSVPAQAALAPSAAAGTPARPAAAQYSLEMQAEIRGLFNSPTVAKNVALRTPELRRFAAFVAPPRQVVAGGFGADGTNGLTTTRFSGAAVVAVPVVAMMTGPAPIKKKL